MNAVLLTFFTMIVIGIIIIVCLNDELFKPRDYTKDYITKGLCPKCKYFDKYSRLCFGPERSRYSKRLGRVVYHRHEPCDGLNCCRDYFPEINV